MTSRMTKMIHSGLLLMITIPLLCSGSAIPMWEYLSRTEKMSHLYQTFASQVSNHCRSNTGANGTPVAECKRDLLMYGVNKLQKLTDAKLDAMDPFQRDANDIIWDSMMEGHPSNVMNKEASTPTPIRELPHIRNPLFDDRSSSKNSAPVDTSDSYADSMDSYNDYTTVTRQELEDPLSNQLPEATNIQLQYFYPDNNKYNDLAGPMVVRVKLDGSPVEEDRLKPLPRDDDREVMTMGRDQLPTAAQIDKLYPKASGFVAVAVAPSNIVFKNAANSNSRTLTTYRTAERTQFRFF